MVRFLVYARVRHVQRGLAQTVVSSRLNPSANIYQVTRYRYLLRTEHSSHRHQMGKKKQMFSVQQHARAQRNKRGHISSRTPITNVPGTLAKTRLGHVFDLVTTGVSFYCFQILLQQRTTNMKCHTRYQVLYTGLTYVRIGYRIKSFDTYISTQRIYRRYRTCFALPGIPVFFMLTLNKTWYQNVEIVSITKYQVPGSCFLYRYRIPGISNSFLVRYPSLPIICVRRRCLTYVLLEKARSMSPQLQEQSSSRAVLTLIAATGECEVAATGGGEAKTNTIKAHRHSAILPSSTNTDVVYPNILSANVRNVYISTPTPKRTLQFRTELYDTCLHKDHAY